MAKGDNDIPTGRIRRTAKVAQVIGTSGAGYAGARARSMGRGSDRKDAELERAHMETAERMVDALGNMKGAAMKIGQFASFIDTEFLPPEYRELYQEKLSTLRDSAPAMPWKDVRSVLEEEWDDPPEELFEDFEHDAAAAASIGQVHRATLCDGRKVAVKIQYPKIARALEADMQNAGMILRLAKAIAPGLDAGAAARELRERVMEELDYEYEAQNQRTFARAYRGHPFIYVPDVITRLSRRRVLVTEWVDGIGFEEVKRLPQEEKDRVGGDRLPLLLRLDLPPAALQRRPPPRQLPADGGRQGRVPRLRHDQAARQGADRARDRRPRRRLRQRPRARCAPPCRTSAS